MNFTEPLMNYSINKLNWDYNITSVSSLTYTIYLYNLYPKDKFLIEVYIQRKNLKHQESPKKSLKPPKNQLGCFFFSKRKHFFPTLL